MTKVIEVAAMVVGGVSLFAVCFLGFAALAGVPLHDVAVVGRLFHAPRADETLEDPLVVATEPPAEAAVAPPGVLGAFRLEPPFTRDELRALEDELELARADAEHRLRELDRREAELDAREAALTARFRDLEDVGARLERFAEELRLREQEVLRDESAAAERQDARWAALARILEEEAPGTVAKRLAEYAPEQAARILAAMDPDVAGEILNEMGGEAFRTYSEAYVEVAPER